MRKVMVTLRLSDATWLMISKNIYFCFQLCTTYIIDADSGNLEYKIKYNKGKFINHLKQLCSIWNSFIDSLIHMLYPIIKRCSIILSWKKWRYIQIELAETDMITILQHKVKYVATFLFLLCVPWIYVKYWKAIKERNSISYIVVNTYFLS